MQYRWEICAVQQCWWVEKSADGYMYAAVGGQARETEMIPDTEMGPVSQKIMCLRPPSRSICFLYIDSEPDFISHIGQGIPSNIPNWIILIYYIICDCIINMCQGPYCPKVVQPKMNIHLTSKDPKKIHLCSK